MTIAAKTHSAECSPDSLIFHYFVFVDKLSILFSEEQGQILEIFLCTVFDGLFGFFRKLIFFGKYQKSSGNYF